MWMLYSLQGTLYSRGSLISQTLLAVIMIVSIYYCIYANLKYKLPTPLKILTVLLFAWTICSFITSISGISVRKHDLLKTIYMSQLPIYVFYVFSRKKILYETNIKIWFFVFMIMAFISYFESRYLGLQEAAAKVNTGDDITNNAGYVILSLLPLLPLFHRKPFIQYLLLFICMLYVLLGFKRGAIISGLICSVWMFFRSFRDRGNSKAKKNITRIFMTLITIIAIVLVIQSLLSTSSYFNTRIEKTLQGDFSGRSEMYDAFFNYYINQTNMFHFLFGNGADATVKIGGHHAHNDWLEIAIDNGLIVLFLYAFYWISLFIKFFKGKKDSIYTMMMGMFIIIYFLKSFFSMSYLNTTLYATCALGYALANYEPQNAFVR